MADFADFGASLQPLVRESWLRRVSLLRTQQSILHAFEVVYDLYSNLNPNDTLDSLSPPEFAERLAQHAGEAGFMAKTQGAYTFVCRTEQTTKAACRFYLNVGTLADRLEVARRLMARLGPVDRDACEFKVLGSHQNRSDNVVVYATQKVFAEIKEILRTTDWEGRLRPEIPAGTKRVLDGIGWAEQPGGQDREYLDNVNALFKPNTIPRHEPGLSFGGVMAACVVLGLKGTMPTGGAWDDGPHRIRYCDAVVEQLRLIGVDARKPHKSIQLNKHDLVERLRRYFEDDPDTLETIANSEFDVLFKDAVQLHLQGEFT
jgi:hypothetical protein